MRQEIGTRRIRDATETSMRGASTEIDGVRDRLERLLRDVDKGKYKTF
jgi:hypothetical protein